MNVGIFHFTFATNDLRRTGSTSNASPYYRALENTVSGLTFAGYSGLNADGIVVPVV